MTTHSDMLFHLGGVPVNSPIMHTGRAFFVKPSSGNDGNDGKTPGRALKTLSKALTLATANSGQAVYLIAESNTASSTTDYQSATLDWNKDGVHLIGIGASPILGQRARIAQLSTVLTVDSLFKLSANNCIIHNIEIFQGVSGSTATTPVAMEVTGQRNLISNCQISGMGDATGANDMDVAAGRSLLLSGAENLFKHCYIGLNTALRATAEAEVEILTGARNIFEDCVIDTYTSNTSMNIVKLGNLDRYVIFKNCILNAMKTITSAAAPDGAFSAATSVNGQVILHHSAVYGCSNVAAADDAKILVFGAGGVTVDAGLASTVDIA